MHQAPYVVGVTGGIGSGKTTVAKAFAAWGVPVVDTDLIAHQLTQAQGAAMPALIAAFGPAIADEGGALDRAAMRKLAFNDAAAKQTLEGILHPLIREQSDREVALHGQQGAAYVLLVVPLLVESGSYARRCDRVLVVDCSEDVQLARVMARSRLKREEVQAIMDKQATRAARLAAADDVINNTALSMQDMQQQVKMLHDCYLKMRR